MRMSRILMAASLACLVPLASGSAQALEARVARAGDRVRVWDGAKRPREGTLGVVTRDSVFVALDGGATLAIPRSAVMRVHVLGVPTAGAGARRGAGYGALVGALIGLYGATRESGCTSGGVKVECPIDDEMDAGTRGSLVLVGAGLGSLVGAGIGAAIPRAEWREATLPLAVTERGLGAACAVPRRAVMAVARPGRAGCVAGP